MNKARALIGDAVRGMSFSRTQLLSIALCLQVPGLVTAFVYYHTRMRRANVFSRICPCPSVCLSVMLLSYL